MTTAIAFSRQNDAGSRVRYLSCDRMGNADLDFETQISDFAIEREIQKQILPPRNLSWGWISIKKSKSGFHGFLFLPFDWEIRKRICKTILVNSSLLFANYAGACKTAVLKDSFSNPFPIERQKGNPNTAISASDFAVDCKSEIRILESTSRFPSRTHP